MRNSVDLSEIKTARICLEKEFRRKAEPNFGIAPIEVAYLEKFRNLLIRFYTELAGGILLTESDLRRAWSTMWDIPVVTARIYDPQNNSHTANVVNRMMTDDERLCLRGASSINKFMARTLHQKIIPVVVDEPFDIVFGDIRVTGRFDLIYQDKGGRYVIVDWTDEPVRYDVKYDLRHAILIRVFQQRFGQPSTVLVDYIRTRNEHKDMLELSTRSEDRLKSQLLEVNSLVQVLSKGFRYKSIDDHCKSCVYKNPCLGETIVTSKRPKSRPGKRLIPEATT